MAKHKVLNKTSKVVGFRLSLVNWHFLNQFTDNISNLLRAITFKWIDDENTKIIKKQAKGEYSPAKDLETLKGVLNGLDS